MRALCREDIGTGATMGMLNMAAYLKCQILYVHAVMVFAGKSPEWIEAVNTRIAATLESVYADYVTDCQKILRLS